MNIKLSHKKRKKGNVKTSRKLDLCSLWAATLQENSVKIRETLHFFILLGCQKLAQFPKVVLMYRIFYWYKRASFCFKFSFPRLLRVSNYFW